MKETIIKCDRCGREYGLDEWPTVEFRGNSPILIRLLAVVSKDKVDERVDLCVDCRRGFREWFNGKEWKVK